MLAGAIGRGGGYGRFYRDRDHFRRDYRERANVGGFFGHILDSREFDFFLTLLIILICINLCQDFGHAPVTAVTVWLMVALYYQKTLGYELITANTFHNYTFHPQKILHDRQWHRLFTAPFLHSGRKLLFYLNLSALSALSKQERAMSQYPPGLRAAFLFVLAGITGIVYIFLCKKYKREAMHTFTCGFTGVLFALKAYLNSSQVGASQLSFPLAGDFYWFSLPVQVPGFAVHFAELFLVSLFFREEANWYLNLAGVITGHFVYAAMTMHKMRYFSHLDTTNWTREWLLQRIAVVLLLVITYLVYKVMDITKKLDQRFQSDKQDKETTTRDVPDEVSYAGDGDASIPSSQQGANTSSLYDEASDDAASEQAGKEKLPTMVVREGPENADDSGDDEYSMLTDAASKGAQTEIPDNVKEALELLTSESVNKDSQQICYALNTVRKMIQNATTRGQQDSKYRRIPLDSKCIQKCNIEGAVELVLALGFDVKEDFDDRKYFVYPRQEAPDWIPAAIEAIDHVLSSYGSESVYDPQSVRAARLKKLTKKKSASRKPRESQYTPGLGGGNSKAIFFHGGT